MNKVVCRTLSLTGLDNITVETGQLACRADGAVLIRYNGTVLLATVVCGRKRSDCDFLPLHVDYQEKFFSVGKIPAGGKREGKLNDHEVLISRLIDRGIRPIFDKDYNNETQVSVTLLSADRTILPESLACFGSSLALLLSPAGFTTPVSEVFVYFINDKWCVNPPIDDIKFSRTRLVVGGDGDNIIMLEGMTNDLTEDQILDGITVAMEVIKQQCRFQKDFIKEVYTTCKIKTPIIEKHDDDILIKKIYDVYAEGIKSKKERNKKLNSVFEIYSSCETPVDVKSACKKAFLQLIKDKKIRLDGRCFDEIRDVSCVCDYLPQAHGSALFTRGETQALATVTLGDKKDEAFKEGVLAVGVDRLFFHYNFPSYCVGEVGPLRSPGRREIGHGQLALNGLRAVMPTEEKDSLYTIRVVSDILSSNGSSSMASVCASSLALMDAGIKIKKQVAGIAMGLLLDKLDKSFIVLSDLDGDEDAFGDMDFKVVGSADGITAIQLDVKTVGLTTDILQKALVQAKSGRLEILKKMNSVRSTPREDVKDFAPHFGFLHIPQKAIGQIIGIGGSKIQSLMRESNSFISITEKGDGGEVKMYSRDKASLEKCEELIRKNAVVAVEGEVYDGTVTLVQDFGAYVEFLPGKVGLLKINDLDWGYVGNMHDFLRAGDKINVKLIKDQGNGKYLLSHKVLIEKQETIEKEVGNDKKTITDRIPDNI